MLSPTSCVSEAAVSSQITVWVMPWKHSLWKIELECTSTTAGGRGVCLTGVSHRHGSVSALQSLTLRRRFMWKSGITLYPEIFAHFMKTNTFGCLQAGLPAHGEPSALVSMFRGIGIDRSMIPLGRAMHPVGQYWKTALLSYWLIPVLASLMASVELFIFGWV